MNAAAPSPAEYRLARPMKVGGGRFGLILERDGQQQQPLAEQSRAPRGSAIKDGQTPAAGAEEGVERNAAMGHAADDRGMRTRDTDAAAGKPQPQGYEAFCKHLTRAVLTNLAEYNVAHLAAAGAHAQVRVCVQWGGVMSRRTCAGVSVYVQWAGS
jgi:hypothetical protein